MSTLKKPSSKYIKITAKVSKKWNVHSIPLNIPSKAPQTTKKTIPSELTYLE